jgi:hypothetical protein
MLTVRVGLPEARSIFLDADCRPLSQPWVLTGPVATSIAARCPGPELEAKESACLPTGRV